MRVLVTPLRVRGRHAGGDVSVAGGVRNDERGVVALVAALLAVVLLLMAGFVVDFGMAYSTKRQLQTASDAASLAATQYYRENLGGPCSPGALTSSLRAAAEKRADDYREANKPGSQGDIVSVECNGQGVRVAYQAWDDSPARLAPLAGAGNQITTSREASAAYDQTSIASGKLRPWGVCSSVANTTGEVTFVGLKGAQTKDGTAGCGTTGDPSGGWWVMECTESGGSTGATASRVTNGCANTVEPVPAQTDHDSTPSELWGFLTTYCPKKTKNATCLASDTGFNVKSFADEWSSLVGQTIMMPVMCDTPKCSSLAVDGSGSTASFAVHQLAVVEVCGFRLHGEGPTAGHEWPAAPDPCSTHNPKGYRSTDIKTGSAGFFLVFKGLIGADAGDGSIIANLRLTK